jgi:signal recognition particle receptor subunit beta
MTVEQDGRQVSVKVALAGAADSGKLAMLRAIATRFGYATVREHLIGAMKVHRVEWTEPSVLPDGRFLNVAIHSLTGQMDYSAAEELLLRGASGIVFVVDVDPAKFQATWDSLMRLSDNTRRNGYDLHSVGLAIQYHRADLYPDFDPQKLDQRLGVPPGLIPRFVSSSRQPDAEGLAFDSVLAQIKASLGEPG